MIEEEVRKFKANLRIYATLDGGLSYYGGILRPRRSEDRTDGLSFSRSRGTSDTFLRESKFSNLVLYWSKTREKYTERTDPQTSDRGIRYLGWTMTDVHVSPPLNIIIASTELLFLENFHFFL